MSLNFLLLVKMTALGTGNMTLEYVMTKQLYGEMLHFISHLFFVVQFSTARKVAAPSTVYALVSIDY